MAASHRAGCVIRCATQSKTNLLSTVNKTARQTHRSRLCVRLKQFRAVNLRSAAERVVAIPAIVLDSVRYQLAGAGCFYLRFLQTFPFLGREIMTSLLHWLRNSRRTSASRSLPATKTLRASRQDRRICSFEPLESRTLLSVKFANFANVIATPMVSSGGYTAGQIASAYLASNVKIRHGCRKSSGADNRHRRRYNDPNISSDLSTFDAKFSLPAANLSVVSQTGATKLPATDSGWGLEISLDVKWAHAIARGRTSSSSRPSPTA